MISRYRLAMANEMVLTCPILPSLGMQVAMQVNSTRSKLVPTILRIAKFNPICIDMISVLEYSKIFIKSLIVVNATDCQRIDEVNGQQESIHRNDT